MSTLPALPWIWPLAGGFLIGCAAGAYLLLVGRVAGISGLLADTAGLARSKARALSALFVSGLLFGSFVALGWWREATMTLTSSWPLLIAGGLLVGYGSRLGSGCTSGHGICGLARGSPRSVVATIVFMGAGFLTVYAIRHVLDGAP